MYFAYEQHALPTLTPTGPDSFTVTGDPSCIFGWSKYETNWWPYLEFNVSF
ncbi:MAG: hypothetical protein V2A77_00270 [Pseudomonadota bacterium]